MKQTNHKRNFILLLILALSVLSGIALAAFCPKEKVAPVSLAYEGNELVLLWNCPAEEAPKARFLSAFPSCSIVETLDDYMLVTVDQTASLADVLTDIRKFPGVTAADPNYTLTLSSSLTEEAPEALTTDAFSDFTAFDLSEGLQYYRHHVIPEHEVIIAVADTGVDIHHPALKDFIYTNPSEIPGDGIDNDKNGYVDDCNGWDFYHGDATVCHYEAGESETEYHALLQDNDNHGTHVAGIIASVLRGGKLGDTEASDVPVKILPMKIHGGEKASGSVANAIKAIKYAVTMQADICNISWGTSELTASITTLETTIRESDLLFIAAAGNVGTDNDRSFVYPASFRMDNVLSVAFVNSYGLLTGISNYGAESVDIAAPGANRYSTVVGGYAVMSGSSMSVPYVSGIAALLCSCRQGIYPATLRALLLSTAVPLPDDSTGLPDTMFPAQGKLKNPAVPGLVRALSAAAQLAVDLTPPTLNPSVTYTKDLIHLNVDARDEGGSGLRVLKYTSGTKNLRAFRHGTVGTTISDGTIRFAKKGKYTLYASDYAGNETILHYTLEEDVTGPTILGELHHSPSGKLHSLLAEVYDSESSVAAIYLVEGAFTPDTFTEEELLTKAIRTFTGASRRLYLRLSAPGPYTLYAKDIRGNTSIAVLPSPKDTEEATPEEISNEAPPADNEDGTESEEIALD